MPAEEMTMRFGRLVAARERRRIMSGLTPQMNPPLRCSADIALERLLEQVAARGQGIGPDSAIAWRRLGPSIVGDEIDAAIVFTEVADLQQAGMRHLQRAGFEQKPRADGVPMRLLVTLEHPDRDRDAEGAMRAADRPGCPAGRGRSAAPSS